MLYKEELTKAMSWLSSKNDTIFLGQTVCYPGTSMFKTFSEVSDEKKIELPVAEELQMGLSIGMGLTGLVPINVYPRFDFLLLAANQLINHLDKLKSMSNNDIQTKVIIRVGVGSIRPLYPGVQHHQDHTEAFEKMLTTLEIIKLLNPSDIMAGYEKAYKRDDGLSTILIEYMDFYNEK